MIQEKKLITYSLAKYFYLELNKVYLLSDCRFFNANGVVQSYVSRINMGQLICF